MPVVLTALAVLIELIAGYPDWLVRSIGHPVTWMGRLIAGLERRWNRETLRPHLRRMLGTVAVLLLVGIVGMVALIIERGLLLLPFGLIGAAVVASTLVAQRSLYQHVSRVADALESGGIRAAREAVSHIVGRDTETLDEAGVARAAIESLAENFSDGVVAPVIWMIIAGLPGAAIYKAINTADSLIGHQSPRYQAFGWAAARLDDLINLPASRLSVFLIIAAAAVTKESSAPAAAVTLVTIAPRTPAILKRQWRARWTSRWQVRAPMTVFLSRMRSWGMAAARQKLLTFERHSRSTVVPTQS